jgi:hypothetical protein
MIRSTITIYRKRLDTIHKMADKVEGSADLNVIEKEKLFEGIFLDAFKSFERTIENLFIGGMLSKEIIKRKKFCSYVHPKNSAHAIDILLLEKDFIDWTNPESIIRRAEALFQNHSIISDCIKNNMQFLTDAKRIRNSIAHESDDSNKQFIKVLNKYFGTHPVRRKTPGWFLNQNITLNHGGPIKILKHFLNGYYNLSQYFI